MPWKVITDAEMRALSVPQRYFAYAYAYRSAAASLCDEMNAKAAVVIWPNAAVVLLLSVHAVELFIKGAILTREPTATIEHHRIDDLAQQYRTTFPDQKFEWEVPFQAEYLGFDQAEIEALRKQTPIPSILYRYPVGKGSSEWNGVFGFEPSTYASVLDKLLKDFQRIEGQLA